MCVWYAQCHECTGFEHRTERARCAGCRERLGREHRLPVPARAAASTPGADLHSRGGCRPMPDDTGRPEAIPDSVPVPESPATDRAPEASPTFPDPERSDAHPGHALATIPRPGVAEPRSVVERTRAARAARAAQRAALGPVARDSEERQVANSVASARDRMLAEAGLNIDVIRAALDRLQRLVADPDPDVAVSACKALLAALPREDSRRAAPTGPTVVKLVLPDWMRRREGGG